MQTRNRATAQNTQHHVEDSNVGLWSSPSRGHPHSSLQRERRRGKDPIVEDQFDPVHHNDTTTQMPFEVTDSEAPVTQAQLAVMFKAIVDVTRHQALLLMSPHRGDRDQEPRDTLFKAK